MRFCELNAFAAAATALILAGGHSANAADRYWDTGLSGSFFSPQNWIDGFPLGIPGINDSAIFDVAGTFAVTFNNSHATNRVLLRTGTVTFELGGAQYSLLNAFSSTPSIVVAVQGETAWLTVINGALSGQFTDVAQLGGSVGLFTVDGANAGLTNEWFLRVGNQGAGIMTVSNGAQVINAFGSIAQASGSFGQVSIDGGGSGWTCDDHLSIGRGGYGTLHISNGGLVECGDAIIAQLLGSIGDVVVSGANTAWLIHGTLDVGMLAPGHLIIENGGLVETDGFVVLSTFQGGKPWNIPGEAGFGKLTIRHLGSQLYVHSDLFVNLSWYSLLRIGRGGRLIVDGLLDQNPIFNSTSPDTQLSIELSSATDYQLPAIQVAESCDAIPARIELVDGFVPGHGDEFHIVSAGSVPAFNFVLPELPAGLAWQTLHDGQNVRLQVLCTAAGDVNDDGAVDVSDLLLVIANWGPCPGGCLSPCPGDATGDCMVAVDDLLDVISTYGMCQ